MRKVSVMTILTNPMDVTVTLQSPHTVPQMPKHGTLAQFRPVVCISYAFSEILAVVLEVLGTYKESVRALLIHGSERKRLKKCKSTTTP